MRVPEVSQVRGDSSVLPTDITSSHHEFVSLCPPDRFLAPVLKFNNLFMFRRNEEDVVGGTVAPDRLRKSSSLFLFRTIKLVQK